MDSDDSSLKYAQMCYNKLQCDGQLWVSGKQALSAYQVIIGAELLKTACCSLFREEIFGAGISDISSGKLGSSYVLKNAGVCRYISEEWLLSRAWLMNDCKDTHE